MLWAAVAYSLGVVAGFYQWRPAVWWLVAGTAFVAAAAYFAGRRSGLGWLLALGALFVAGALQIQARAASTLLDTAIQPYADRQELQIIAHVTRDGRLQPGAFNEIRQTIDVETEEVQTAEGKREAIHSGVRLSIYSPHPDPEDNFNLIRSMPLLHYGDRIRFSAKLRAPRNFQNPGAFDYRGYLANHNIAALAPPKWKTSNGSPDFPAAASRPGAVACTAESSQQCTNSGLRASPP